MSRYQRLGRPRSRFGPGFNIKGNLLQKLLFFGLIDMCEDRVNYFAFLYLKFANPGAGERWEPFAVGERNSGAISVTLTLPLLYSNKA
ncbi:hypothetical protein I532_19921 [Brevibacillus borstelensis AK1]|jgi:hypothetical protein|uniref:Uncharacterized protein n=1 Tax=Brevibacillus borstelensis AK1 TaxID=1300222 RepID=M8DBX4_9BACL|nr:hypothetical protein I532_19921 [Brevibacillus borstelensis AK1]